MNSIEQWSIVLFSGQLICFFLPEGTDLYIRFFPSIVFIAWFILVMLSALLFFIVYVITGFRKEMKRRKDLLKMPEKEE
jgi:uncharacterized membrane protein YbhN (UPF0104 family)